MNLFSRLLYYLIHLIYLSPNIYHVPIMCQAINNNEMQAGAVTMENFLAVAQKSKRGLAVWSSNTTPGHISGRSHNSKKYMHPCVHSSGYWLMGLLRWHGGKESACQCRRHKRRGFNPWVRKTPGSRKSNILAWKIPWAEESDGLYSRGWQRVGRDWAQHSSSTLATDNSQERDAT